MRGHEVATPPYTELAHHRQMSALQNFYDLSISPAIRLDACNTRHHPIAMHGLRSRLVWNEDVSAQPCDGVIGNNKSVTFAVHVQAPDGVFAAGPSRDKVAGT